MVKSYRFLVYFFMMLAILIACTKEVNLVTEVEFDLLGDNTEEGYVKESLATVLTISPEEILEEITYGFKYTVEEGEGFFEDDNGEPLAPGEMYLFEGLSQNLHYIGSEAGEHKVLFQAEDSYGFAKELELVYTLENVPATWTATAADEELLVGDETTITVTLGDEGAGYASYERNYKITVGSGEWTKEDGTGLETDTFVQIVPGTYQYNFIAQELGTVVLTFDLQDGNGQKITTEVALEVVEELSSGENNILSFSLSEQIGTAIIDSENHTISVTVPEGSERNIAPSVLTVSEGATVSPGAEEQQDFMNQVVYTVTAENGDEKEWTVTVMEQAIAIEITSFSINGVEGSITDTEILLELPSGTDVTALIPTIGIVGESVNPMSGVEQDFSNPITYTVMEGSMTKAYTVTVTTVANQPPTASDVTVNVITNSANNSIDMEPHIGDPENDNLTVGIGSGPTNGNATISGTIINYTPNNGFSGGDEIIYTVNDGNNPTESGTLSVQVNGVANEPPTANDFTFTVDANSSNNAIELSGEINDPENDNLTVGIGSGPTNGNATISGTIISYTPNNGFSGEDEITYTVNDGNNPAVSGTLSVQVNGVANEPPTANDFTFTVDANSSNNAIELSGEINDPENDNLTVGIGSGPTNGNATISGTIISYTPNNGFSGGDEIIYTVNDGNNPAESGTLSVQVNGVANEPPTANDFTFTVDANSSNNAIELSGEINDPENDNLTVGIGSGPTNGNATISGTIISYTPNNGFSGGDEIIYTVNDGNNPAVSGTLSIQVNGVANEPPTANDFTFTVDANSSNNAIELSGEINDPENDNLTVAIGSGPFNGSATISGTIISYTPNNGFSGNDGITYTVNDGNNPAVSGTLTVEVNGVPNEPPTANDFTFTVAGNSSNNAIELSGEINDPENDNLTVGIGSGPTNGNATISGTIISYTPNNGFSGEDEITYTVNDGNNPAVSGTLTVTVTNIAPEAVASGPSSAAPNSVVLFTGSGSSDPNGDTLTYLWDFGDGNTSSQMNPSHTYTSSGDYNVELTVNDGNGGSDSVIISITIETPTTFDPLTGRYTAPAGTSINVNLESYGTGKGGATLSAHTGSNQTGTSLLTLQTSWNESSSSTFFDDDNGSFIMPSSGEVYFYGRHTSIIPIADSFVAINDGSSTKSHNLSNTPIQ
ncbi:Ig-like domain-containing protein [Zobellia galactanivorans]|uniref:PKD repeats containing lipoprotein n=1 Tax=Zobellia galactanivorans (strain DSM 12802 / CCUG 47099 / CIP 106680 / NCIMB 13871 / Dsij) TaxID=63186 RepID=G0L9F4_ZOBGA|nr:Ig-like domain-containing protein [Zobellia galactanivorans]CAZ94534.1 PKD repeats containing lipoprotein [Zobellia galactanivorans]